MIKTHALKILLLSVAASLFFLFVWHSYYLNSPIGFRPFRLNIHEVLRDGLYCNDFPACFRIGANIIYRAFWAIFSNLGLDFLEGDKFNYILATLTMVGLTVTMVHCFLLAGSLKIQLLFVSLFFLNPLLYHKVGIIHHDVSTLAFWAFIFLFSKKILDFRLSHKLILIMIASLFYENNGPILAFAFWAHDLRSRICEGGLSKELLWIGFKSGPLYLLPAIIASAHVYVVSSYINPDGVYFFSEGSSFRKLWDVYGANNYVLITGFRLLEVLWFSVFSLFIILWVVNKRELTEFEIVKEYVSESRGSFLCFVIVGFFLTLGVGQLIAGIRYEWPRQFLPLSFMLYFLFSLIVSREINESRT